MDAVRKPDMRALLQRVSRASVSVAGATTGEIDRGLLVFLGVTHSDTPQIADHLTEKVLGLRIFEDDAGKMNLDVSQAGGAVLCVSQFTLYADTRRGRRPSFDDAARPEPARLLYERFCSAIEARGVTCARGSFGAHMEVTLVNDGPVTILIDSDDLARPRRT
jgi:D-tyrosyl-tRNA(Tyr) deacylase